MGAQILIRILTITGLVLMTLAARAETTMFKIATISPDGALWMVKMRAGAGEIEKRTQGRVKFKFYPGGIMGNDQSVLRKIRIGQLHGGAITGGSLADIYPDSQVYGFPLMFRSFDEVDYVRQRMDDLIIKGMEKHGFINFGLAEGGFAYLMCDKPLVSIKEVKEHKVWVPAGEPISRTVFDVAGISPIPLPLSDVLTGLQTGLIDSVATSPIAAIALQWHTKVKYLTDTPLTYITAFLVIDRKAFMRLASNDQAIVREVMGHAFKEIDAQNRRDNINAKNALRKQGIEFVKPNANELVEWRKIAAESRRRLEAKGLYSPEMLSQLRTHLNAYRKTQVTGPSSQYFHGSTALR
jgi:TRAP-type transport system periplasmic protein